MSTVLSMPLKWHSISGLTLFAHGLGEILEHGEGVLEDVVEKDLARAAVHDAEVHRVRVEGRHLRLHGDDLIDALGRRLENANRRTQANEEFGRFLLDGVIDVLDAVDFVGGLAVVRAGMHMDHGGAGLEAFVGFVRKFLDGVGNRGVIVLVRGSPRQCCTDDNGTFFLSHTTNLLTL